MGAEEASASSVVLLDGCVVINLHATRRFEEIISAQPFECHIAEYVQQRESLFVGSEPGSVGGDWERVDLSQARSTGLLTVDGSPTEAEMATFVDLAADMDDGEAMTGALATHRGYSVATDDRKAIRIFSRRTPVIRVIRTTELVKCWVECKGIGQTVLRAALLDIRLRARFLPPADDPLGAWWRQAVGDQ